MNSQPGKYLLNTETEISDFYRYIDILYPFGFALDRSSKITWSGRTFQKFSGGSENYFIDHCSIKRPINCQKTYDDILNRTELLFFLTVDHTPQPLVLKGQFILQTTFDHLIFCGSPVLNKEDELIASGLRIGDFSVNDISLDYLNMQSFHKLSTEDMNRMFREAENKAIEISKQRAFYEKVLNNIPVDIAIFDKDQNYIFLNKHAVTDPELRQWLVGRNDFDYARLKGIDTAIAEKRRDLFKRACSSGNPEEWTEAYKKNGRTTYVLRRFLPYFNNGEISQVIGYGVDITSNTEIQEELRRNNLQMSAILESITDGFISMDSNMIVNFWNNKASEFAMMSREEIIGKHFSSAIDTPDGELLLEIISSSLKQQKQKHLEFYYSPRQEWYEISCYPNPTGLSVFFRSIQYRKSMERKQELELRLELALNNFNKDIIDVYDESEIFWIAIENVIRVLDLEDCVFYRWNETTERLIQTAAMSNKLSTNKEIINPIQLELGEGIVGDAALTKKAQLVTNTALDPRYIPDDNLRASELATPIIIGNELIGVLDSEHSTPGFFQDFHERTFQRVADIIAVKISEIRAHKMALHEKENRLNMQQSMNDKLQQKSDELQRSNKELEHFAYTVSHDLQEPLRMITTFLDKLNERIATSLDERSKQYMALTLDGAKRMHQNIMDLLEYSRASSLAKEKSEINTETLINKVRQALRRVIQESDATISYVGPRVIFSHSTPLYHILHNLADNSIKYRQPGTAPRILIECRKTENGLDFSFSDNGIGIPHDSQERIFKIFQQLHKNKGYSGSGVGLSIVKKVIENLGGNISVQSTPGVGTVFHFNIPN